MNEVISDLVAFRAQAAEGIGGEGYRFQLEPGGEIFLVPHPLLLDDDANDAIKVAVGNVDVARAIMGTEAYERFRAAGGRSGDVLLAWRKLTRDMSTPDPK